ncbi:rolling circle replication-associated protein [Flagellimonas marinaquae]
MIVKNTYGTSIQYSPKAFGYVPTREFVGSSLLRKKQQPKEKKKITDSKTDKVNSGLPKQRSLSPRSKQKIKRKVVCFSRCYDKMSFVTLTFLNKVDDVQAVKMLKKFLDNAKKRLDDFQYIWVAERQTKNDEFKGNVHFHIITNKYWKIDKWWDYWIDLQLKNGIKPRDKNFKPSSAFDVKRLNSKNIKAIGTYVTKYVTKNKATFRCQVWNCSKAVSLINTDFYTSHEFLENFERLNAIRGVFKVKDKLGETLITVKNMDLNRQTLHLYRRLDERNKAIIE